MENISAVEEFPEKQSLTILRNIWENEKFHKQKIEIYETKFNVISVIKNITNR